MANQAEVVRAFTALLGLKQTVQEYRYALTGQGTGADSADVEGRAGWAHVRYDENLNRVSQVFNPKFPGIPEGVPVIIGKERAIDEFVQILGLNWPVYFMGIPASTLPEYTTPAHGSSHNAATGGDPAYLDIRNLLPGHVRPSEVPDLSVSSEALYYDYVGDVVYFPGEGIDLTASVPGAANQHRYTMVAIDASTNGLAFVDGLTTPLAVTPDPPAVPSEHVPLACILLQNGATTIVHTDIIDYRILFTGPDMATADIIADLTALGNMMVHEGAVVTHNGEVVLPWPI